MSNDQDRPAGDEWGAPDAPLAPASPYGAPDPYAAPPVPAQPDPYGAPAAAPGFGGPAPWPQQTAEVGYGVPGYPLAQPPKSSKKKWILIGVGVFVALLALSRVADLGNSKKALTAPATLGGRTISTSSEAAANAASATAELKKENGGRGGFIAFYGGDDDVPEFMLVALRARTNEDREVNDVIKSGIDIDKSSRREIDGSTCYTTEDGTQALCNFHGSISGSLITITDGDIEKAASIAKEARSALK